MDNHSVSNLKNSIALVFIMLTNLTRLSQNANYIQTKCFEDVAHYHSNPQITKSTNVMYVYRNNWLRNITFHLTCADGDYEDVWLQVEAVKLILPATETGYCLDSKVTNYNNCAPTSPCNCCKIPVETCQVPLHKYLSSCNGQPQCDLVVSSEFLDDCPGREYDCENEKCHSRWAQVNYTCHATIVATEVSHNDGGDLDSNGVSTNQMTNNGKPVISIYFSSD